MKNRILFSIALFFLAYLAPWWFLILIALLASLYFEFYLEAVFVGFFLDAAYAAGRDAPFSMPFFFTVLFGACFFLIHLLKRHLRFYREI